MRLIAAATGLMLLGLAPSLAEAAEPAQCLSPGEAQEWVGTGRVISPTVAILAARAAVPQSDILRASLCRDGPGLVYLLLAMRKDGRVVHVTIDAPSGKVAALR